MNCIKVKAKTKKKNIEMKNKIKYTLLPCILEFYEYESLKWKRQ